MNQYRLLILGHHPAISDWSGPGRVFEMLTFAITQGFGVCNHVEVATVDVRHYPPISQQPLATLPQADIVLVVSFSIEDPDMAAIKRETGARFVASFRENPSYYDHSFTCIPAAEPNATTFRLPCWKMLLPNCPKVPGSILVDHTWYTQDRTAEIEGWLEGYTQGPVYRLLRPGTDNHPVPGWMRHIDYAAYPTYLNRTAFFERHIITHIEGYPWGVIDFAARGTQVLTPPDLIPKSMIEELGIPVFDTREELLAILDQPVGDEWDRKIDLCTDYTDVARAMDSHFQEWLT